MTATAKRPSSSSTSSRPVLATLQRAIPGVTPAPASPNTSLHSRRHERTPAYSQRLRQQPAVRASQTCTMCTPWTPGDWSDCAHRAPVLAATPPPRKPVSQAKRTCTKCTPWALGYWSIPLQRPYGHAAAPGAHAARAGNKQNRINGNGVPRLLKTPPCHGTDGCQKHLPNQNQHHAARRTTTDRSGTCET